MKKLLYAILMLTLAISVGSCKKSEEKKVLNFGIYFAEMVQNNDTRGIRQVYPDVGNYESAHLSFSPDRVDVFRQGDGVYKVRYDDGAYIIVRTGLKGAMEVLESEGIFSKSSKSGSSSKRSTNSAFNDGHNTLDGSFNYKGAEYGFYITFDYDTSTGTVTGAHYKAKNGSSNSGNKITSMIISSDESEITISGPGLSITASGSPGSYSGYMTRGSHSGSIRMWN